MSNDDDEKQQQQQQSREEQVLGIDPLQTQLLLLIASATTTTTTKEKNKTKEEEQQLRQLREIILKRKEPPSHPLLQLQQMGGSETTIFLPYFTVTIRSRSSLLHDTSRWMSIEFNYCTYNFNNNDSCYPGERTFFFLLSESYLMDIFLERYHNKKRGTIIANEVLELTIFRIDTVGSEELEHYKTLSRILKRRLPNIKELQITTCLPPSFNDDDHQQLDDKLALLLSSCHDNNNNNNKWSTSSSSFFPNLKELWLYISNEILDNNNNTNNNNNGAGAGAGPISTVTATTLPKFYKSIRHLPSLESIYLETNYNNGIDPTNFLLTSECLYNLADSIESLPLLNKFIMDDWIVVVPVPPPNNNNNNNNDPAEEEDFQKGWEAIACAIGSHPNLDLKFNIPANPGRPYTPAGDDTAVVVVNNLHQLVSSDLEEYRIIPEDHFETIGNGPNVHQVLTQLQRQGKLPPDLFLPNNNNGGGMLPKKLLNHEKYDLYDHSENNNNLECWVQALIAVKDIQLKGKDRWDVFHFLFCQLVGVLNYNNCSKEYWDATDPNDRVPWLLTTTTDDDDDDDDDDK